MTGKVSSDTITPTRAHVEQSPMDNPQSNLKREMECTYNSSGKALDSQDLNTKEEKHTL